MAQVSGFSLYIARDHALVQYRAEEGPEFRAFDVIVATVDGKDYVLPAWEMVTDPEEGWRFPRSRYRQGADALVAKIEARGFIDLDHWIECEPEMSSEDREAYNLRCEMEERGMWGMAA